MKSTNLYNSKQLYQIEHRWFNEGNSSYGLMQQASWHIASLIDKNINMNNFKHTEKTALVWVGSGNNGGDGWLVAHYLHQFGWHIAIMEVEPPNTSDSKKAKEMATNSGCFIYSFDDNTAKPNMIILPKKQHKFYSMYIDAIFGIGLDREPKEMYAKAINHYNQLVSTFNLTSVSIDIPSGLVASTGQVFNETAIKSEITFCLTANKFGLFTKDGKDHTSKVITLPLIPIPIDIPPIAKKLTHPLHFSERNANKHKGSFGHLLIIGGNQTTNGHGMGGATILATQGAFAVGVGKVSVACHPTYHSSLISNMPNAMSLNLHNIDSVCNLMTHVEIVAIGMGLGRDDEPEKKPIDEVPISTNKNKSHSAKFLFEKYIAHAILNKKDILIDADGLYHLATCSDAFINKLASHAKSHFVAFTPHSGEMARLLNMRPEEVESNRLSALKQASKKYGGQWLLKGSGSLVIENGQCYLCDAGNSGMATAGMGDVLSGIIAGIQAQEFTNTQRVKKINPINHSLINGVIIHAMAGDLLAKESSKSAIMAQDIYKAVATVLYKLENPT